MRCRPNTKQDHSTPTSKFHAYDATTLQAAAPLNAVAVEEGGNIARVDPRRLCAKLAIGATTDSFTVAQLHSVSTVTCDEFKRLAAARVRVNIYYRRRNS